MTQPHDLVGQTPSGYGLLGIVERDETGVLCHECGRWFGGLSWHITKTHGMSVAEYRSVHQLPAGAPLVSLATSAKISASFSAPSGVISEGLNTMVLPQASAGADFQQAIWVG